MLFKQINQGIIGLLIVIIATGCGFQPIYGDRASGVSTQTAVRLANIKIQTIPDRQGQILRNLLLERLNPRGEPSNPQYFLKTSISYSTSGLGTNIDDETSRARLTATANFTLSGDAFETPKRFTQTIRVAYSVGDELYPRKVVLDDALKRALRIIADDARLQLAALLTDIP